MDEYQQIIIETLKNGNFKENRTGVSTISKFNYNYEIDLQKGFPLLTTKKMDGSRWESMVYELLWYLSGENHIRNLQEHTSIWDAWADEDGNLDTAYGRFWRRYPLPANQSKLEGESWNDIHNNESNFNWMQFQDGWEFDQIQYVIDNIKENPNSRRHVVTSWHPANAAVSTLPPCHLMFIFNVQNGKLNCHLTQRSADIAVGVPFNIASYALLTHLVANEVDMPVGTFGHSLVDAHIYCGEGERAKWYKENINRLGEVAWGNISILKDDIKEKAPGKNEDNMDHIPNLLEQLLRVPKDRPAIDIADKPIDQIEFEDIKLKNYHHEDSLRFGVAE